MEKWKEIGKKLIFPPIWVIVILTVVCTALLIVIFVNGFDDSIPAYLSYSLSFYTLVVICFACQKSIPAYYQRIKKRMHKNKYLHRYLTDAVFKSNVGLYCSMAINVIYVIANAIFAYLYHTYWFGIFALYYAVIAIMRFLLIRHVLRHPIGENHLGELKRARLCAFILMTVNLALTGAVSMMIYYNRGFHYRGHLIYVIAMYTFYITTTSVMEMLKYRKYKSPILSVTKMIKMTSALFSMLFLETAMFAQFGEKTSQEEKNNMIGLTGAVICIVVVIMAVYMIVQTSKEMKQIKRSEANNGQ